MFERFRRREEVPEDRVRAALTEMKASRESLQRSVANTVAAADNLERSAEKLRSILYETTRRAHEMGPIVMKTNEAP